MWNLSEPWWELLLRGSLVYLVLFALLRFSGKRQAGQMTPFDLLLLLIISNAVQNAMIGQDTSVLGGLIVAGVLVAWNNLLGWLTSRHRRIEALLDGRPEVLVHNGRVFEDVLARNRMSLEELQSALRREGCFDLNDVGFAVLETNGAVSVKRRTSA
ncbi:MAG TPA: YetF domain-containing protein [Tahibacter sp.]|uniref:DUF421 domain-containing protein n=1 Tax=Tahibacter sp. TaxID=2056211 RepID=UPI002CAED7DE|nr:YetF domain-containing protein [Tahibacter sp.]HSX61641.1 YetF domain-containing protein [Tahibacter sp.]